MNEVHQLGAHQLKCARRKDHVNICRGISTLQQTSSHICNFKGQPSKVGRSFSGFYESHRVASEKSPPNGKREIFHSSRWRENGLSFGGFAKGLKPDTLGNRASQRKTALLFAASRGQKQLATLPAPGSQPTSFFIQIQNPNFLWGNQEAVAGWGGGG